VGERSALLEGDVVEAVRRLREEVDGIILVAGSRTLVHTLLENDLVDELRLMVFPVVLGSGGRGACTRSRSGSSRSSSRTRGRTSRAWS
jgi:dihydrofolate reductase